MKNPRVFLVHIQECLERIEEYTVGGEVAFMELPMIQDAVIRNLEVIGEAAKRIPDEFRAEHPEVPWKRYGGLRDVLIHQYEGVDLGQVWRIVDSVLPDMREQIDQLILENQTKE